MRKIKIGTDENAGDMIRAPLCHRKRRFVQRAVQMALRLRLVDGKGIVPALEREAAARNAVGGIQDRHAVEIRIVHRLLRAPLAQDRSTRRRVAQRDAVCAPLFVDDRRISAAVQLYRHVLSPFTLYYDKNN